MGLHEEKTNIFHLLLSLKLFVVLGKKGFITNINICVYVFAR